MTDNLERRHYYNGMYATCATVGFIGAYLIFLGVGVVFPLLFLALAAASATFAASSFAKRNQLQNEEP